MNSRYTNQIPTTLNNSIRTLISILRDYRNTEVQRKPKRAISSIRFQPELQLDDQQTKATWFGHSAALLEIEGKRILLDPMFGEASSPFPIFNGKRFSDRLPIEPEELPAIDAILLSHNHYDHLHYGSFMKLKDKVGHIHVPLGVARYLVKWGIDPAKISEYRWWDGFDYRGLRMVCTPARHFSGRGLFDRDRSLWCSWVIQGKSTNVFFSGDSGYGPHFQEIGEKFGPFDLTLMECGQYDERWAAIHMNPEETVQAHLDVQGKMMIPIHWGAFTLALHAWTDPIERAVKAAQEKQVCIATPQIGETVVVGLEDYPNTAWWRTYS